VTVSKTGAENKVSALEQKEQELQAFIQQLSMDLQKATAETQEKEKLITHLQEKVSSLEKKLEQNLSGEEHVQELLKEKTVAEQNLEATRQQLMAARSSQAKAIDILETRVKELELSLQASEEKLKHSDDVLAAQEAQIQELRELEQENAALKESKNECERSLQHHQLELKKLKVFT